MRRVFVFFILSLILGHGAFAECVSVDTVTKCARLPDSLAFSSGSISDSWVDNDNGLDWSAVYKNSIVVSGTTVGDLSDDITCVISSPFKAEATVLFEPSFMFSDVPAEICSNKEYVTSYIYDSFEQLDGDICPDGFYTVPYEISCGEGLVDISDAPNCDDDTSGEFCLVDMSSSSPCVSTDTVTKCARLPTDFRRFNIEGAGDYTDSSWSIIYDGAVYSGNSAECMEIKLGHSCQCVVNSPFNAVIKLSTGPMKFGTAYEACSGMTDAEMVESYVFDGRLDGDMCPDGFYTVPYDMSCGEGLVGVVGVPECENDVSGDYCLMPPSAAPCAAGVSTLRTGTGLTIPLWADKNTTPALAVRYNNMTCWGNLQSGQVTNGINVKYNNQVYHLVE